MLFFVILTDYRKKSRGWFSAWFWGWGSPRAWCWHVVKTYLLHRNMVKGITGHDRAMCQLGLSFPAYGATNSIMGSLPVSYYLSKDIHSNVIRTWIQGSSLQYMNFSEHTQIIVQTPPNQVFSYFHVLQFSRHLDHQSIPSHVKQEIVADGT